MTIDEDRALDALDPDELARQRGPMRPDRLLSVRARQSRRLAAHTFRFVDLVALIALCGVGATAASPQRLMDTSLGRVVPFVVGAVGLARMIRATGSYRFGRRESAPAHLGRIALSGVIAVLASVCVAWLFVDDAAFVRSVALWLILSTVALIVLHALWVLLVGRWRRAGWLIPNIAIVGATAQAEELIVGALEHRDLNVIGIFDDRRERSPFAVNGVPVLGDVAALVEHKIVPYVDLIVIAVDPAASARVRQITAQLSVLPNKVTLLVDSEGGSRAAAIAQFADAPLAPLNSAVDDDRRTFAKRMQDLVLGVPLLLLAAPVMALVALAIKLDSPGPVFFRQRRHGFNNEQILVWKFRSMRHEAADATAARQVTANDDRVTRVGRVLRSTSLDELPQLFNVIRGEMSLVGPRPHAIGMKTGDVESARLVAEYAHRHRVKPGMTGWAAINGSRGPLHEAAEVGRRVALDVDYIERHSFWLDLRIIALTIPNLLGDRHAVR